MMTYNDKLRMEFNAFYESNKTLFALACETSGENAFLDVIESCANIIFNNTCDLLKFYKKRLEENQI